MDEVAASEQEFGRAAARRGGGLELLPAEAVVGVVEAYAIGLRVAAAEIVGLCGVTEHHGKVEAVWEVVFVLELVEGESGLVEGVARGRGDQLGEGEERSNANS